MHGRGCSDGTRFFVGHFHDYLADVKALLDTATSRDAALPVYLLGHSAGGVVASMYAMENREQLPGLICESFAFEVLVPAVVLQLVKLVGSIAPRLPVLQPPNEKFSRDPHLIPPQADAARAFSCL